MATVTQGSSESFTLDAFGYLTITQCGSGTLAGVSHAPNIKSDVSYTKIAPVQYGPFGVPMDMTLTATDRDITYSTTGGYGGAITTNSDGRDVIVGPDGTEYPLPMLTGSEVEATLDGSPVRTVHVDAGSDAHHGQIVWTINCGVGETPDDSLASDRFVDYADHPEVWRSGIDGESSSQAFLIEVPAGATLLHIAEAGSAGPYTASADTTFGADEMAVLVIDDAAPAYLIAITMLSSKTAGGTNYRAREISVTPWAEN